MKPPQKLTTPTLHLLLLWGVIFLAFGSILRLPFTDIDTWPLILTSSFYSWEEFRNQFQEILLDGRMVNAQYYRPLLTVSYGIDRLIWNLNPFGYHLTDLVLHGLNTVGVYLLGRALFGQRLFIVLFGSLLFALHPLHVENVPAIARRAQLLAGFFFLSSLILVVHALKTQGPKKTRWVLISIATWSFFCGLLSKESAILFLGILPGAIFFFHSNLKQISFRNKWRPFLKPFAVWGIPFAAVTGFYLALRISVLGGIGGYVRPQEFSYRFWSNLVGTPIGLFFAGFSPWWTDMAGQILSLYRTQPVALGFLGFLFFLLLAAVGVGCVQFFRQRFKPGTSEITPTLFFLVFMLLGQSLFLLLFGFNFRYLYLEIVPFAFLLAFAVHSLPQWFPLLRRGLPQARFSHGAAIGLVVVTAGNLIFGSLVFSKTSLNLWKEDATLAARIFKQVGEVVSEAEPGTYVGLINFPYQRYKREFSTKFFMMPLSIISLEHALQAYVDLQFPEKKAHIVGLSYLYEAADKVAPLEINAAFENPGNVFLSIKNGGVPTPHPWAEDFGPRYRGRLFAVSQESSDRLTVRFTNEWESLPNKILLLYDGHPSLRRLPAVAGPHWKTARLESQP